MADPGFYQWGVRRTPPLPGTENLSGMPDVLLANVPVGGEFAWLEKERFTVQRG